MHLMNMEEQAFKGLMGSHQHAEVYVNVLVFFYFRQITSYSSYGEIAVALKTLLSVLLCSTDIQLRERKREEIG